jgi:putative NIF3 family GTP cyclohydrolase 1 type 2
VASFADLEIFLSEFLLAAQFADDQNGVYRASSGEVTRLGLALEPWPGVSGWITENALDALFLHRPWKLGRIPNAVGVLAYHYAFDERLTTGYNPLLAQALTFSEPAVLGYKDGRPLGMIGDVPRTPLSAFQARVEEEFGGLSGVYGANTGDVTRACVVGAMRPALIYEAAERGAQVYLTGEYRRGAAQAVAETGMSVFELGHRRSEVWGLRTLATVLRARFPELEVVLSAR